jgi:cytoskeletal protein RodZ
MPVLNIKNGEMTEIENVKKKDNKENKVIKENSEVQEKENVWLDLLLNKFNLILIAIIVLLAYLLYRAYKNE